VLRRTNNIAVFSDKDTRLKVRTDHRAVWTICNLGLA